jgi:hypothetical protein
MRLLLCRDDGSTRVGTWDLFPAAVDRLFRGIDSERGIAWRAADSLALRDFLGMGLDAAPPDLSMANSQFVGISCACRDLARIARCAISPSFFCI